MKKVLAFLIIIETIFVFYPFGGLVGFTLIPLSLIIAIFIFCKLNPKSEKLWRIITLLLIFFNIFSILLFTYSGGFSKI